MPAEKISPGRYRHFKGGEYEVVGLARHSETLEELVVYWMLKPSEFGEKSLWVRPLAMFTEGVELPDGRRAPRFERVS